jgi:hypothetical protein
VFAGVPVVTLEGQNVAGRVSGGLLKAAGLGDLVMPDKKSYVRMAVNLLRRPTEISKIKSFIRDKGLKSLTFNAKQRTVEMEAAYVHALKMRSQGQPLANIVVSQGKPPKKNTAILASALPAKGESEWIPVSLDVRHERIYYAAGVDPIEAANATFHGEFTEKKMDRLYAMTWAHRIAIDSRYAVKADPVVVFSPGRCGSILLTKLLNLLEVRSVSEPRFMDIFAKQMQGESLVTEQQKVFSLVMEDILGPIQLANESPVVLKMHTDANYSPALMVSTCRERPKTIFITRGFQKWAESRWRAFNEGIEEDFEVYHRSLRALEWLKEKTECLVISYEELVSEPERLLKQLGVHLGSWVEVDKEALSLVMSRDSQEDSSWARSRLTQKIIDETKQQIRDYWIEHAPQTLLKKLGLDELI